MPAERTVRRLRRQASRGARAPRRVAAPDRQRHQDFRRRARGARAQRHLASCPAASSAARSCAPTRSKSASIPKRRSRIHRAVPERLGHRRPSDVRPRRGQRRDRKRPADGGDVPLAARDQRAARRRRCCTSRRSDAAPRSVAGATPRRLRADRRSPRPTEPPPAAAAAAAPAAAAARRRRRRRRGDCRATPPPAAPRRSSAIS